MAKLRTYTLSWGVPVDSDIVNIRVRASIDVPSSDPNDPATYAIPYDEVGVVSQCLLPLPKTPKIDGDLSIGVSPVDDQGNEGDISWIRFPFDLQAPSPVIGLSVS